MAEYNINNVCLLISQQKFNETIKAGDLIYVDRPGLDFLRKILIVDLYTFSVEENFGSIYIIKILGKETAGIFTNTDDMRKFLKDKRSGYKEIVEKTKAGKLNFPNKQALIDTLISLDNSDYFRYIKEFLSLTSLHLLNDHYLESQVIFKSVDEIPF